MATTAGVRTGNVKLRLTFGFEELSVDPAVPLSGPTPSGIARVLAAVEALAAFSTQAVEFNAPLVGLLSAVQDRWLRARAGATPLALEHGPERIAWEKIDPLYAPALASIAWVHGPRAEAWFPRTGDEEDRFRPYCPIFIGGLRMGSPLDVLHVVPWGFLASGGFWVFLKGLEHAFGAPGRIKADRQVQAAREAAAQADRAEAEARRARAELELQTLVPASRGPARLVSGTVELDAG